MEKFIAALSLVSLTLVFFSCIVLNTSYGEVRLAPKTTLDHYIENELILVGKVTSLSEDPKQRTTEYEIKVEKYLKSPKIHDAIIVVGDGIKSSEVHSSIEKIFGIGDRVLLFLNKINGTYNISPYSVIAAKFDPDSDFILPPLRLYKAGISLDDIVCRGELTLMLKSTNMSPACVKPNHVEKLIATGWAYLK